MNLPTFVALCVVALVFLAGFIIVVKLVDKYWRSGS